MGDGLLMDGPSEKVLVDVAPENLMACSECDALYQAVAPEPETLIVCERCHHVIARPRRKAGMTVISLAFATLVLVVAATFLPFLSISVAGVENSASLIDTALAFSEGGLAFLALATVALIILIPTLRMLLILYVLVPIVFDRPPARRAKSAFRMSIALKPWSMAEIFVIGCAVALVKIVDLADVAFGPAFWMFSALVIIVTLQERLLCSWSVWNALEQPQS